MTIGISDEHVALHDSVRRWVEAHADLSVTRAVMDSGDPSTVPPFWDDLVKMGWLGLHLPEEHGGEGYGLAELVVVLEELGRVCAPGPFLPTVMASALIAELGTDEQKARWLPGLADGTTLGSVAFLPGGDILDVEHEGDPSSATEVVVNGRCRAVIGADAADRFVVPLASPDGWCVVDRDHVEVVTRSSVDPTRGIASVVFDDVTISLDDVLRGSGEPGTRGQALTATLVAAECLGAAAWCVETASEYAKVRVQFGRPIGQFQAVKHRCTDMLLRLESARAATWDAARGGDADEQLLAGWVAGSLGPNASFVNAMDCIQTLGGIGYTWEHDAHLFLKRALTLHQLLDGDEARRQVAALALAGRRRSFAVELPAEAEAHRVEVRRFLDELRASDKAEWNRRIADSGYLVPYWPSPFGRDAGAVEQLVIDEEFAAAHVRRPHLQVGAWVLPTLIAHGTVEQQERWIGPTMRGEILWCQLFSEPGAGSDLASLSTRAERVDGGWSLTGQKVWTTMAHIANWGICLARTNPDVPKHDGITCFIVDMTSPGIDIRPLKELTGVEFFNEVFFDSVFVPDDCVVGDVDSGWEAGRTTLANERVSMGSGSSFGPGVESVLALVAGRDEPSVVEDLADVGTIVTDAHAISAMALRTTLRALSGAKPGPEASVRKLIGVEHEQRVQEIGLALLGPEGAIDDGEAKAWVGGFLGNRALSIAGGTSDVQRNIIAERLLGLPKDP